MKPTFISKIPIVAYIKITTVIKHDDTKTACIRALYDRTNKISSNINLFQKQVVHIKNRMPWNGYPHYVRNKTVKRLKNWKNT